MKTSQRTNRQHLEKSSDCGGRSEQRCGRSVLGGGSDGDRDEEGAAVRCACSALEGKGRTPERRPSHLYAPATVTEKEEPRGPKAKAKIQAKTNLTAVFGFLYRLV
jgi:hypothetical protein